MQQGRPDAEPEVMTRTRRAAVVLLWVALVPAGLGSCGGGGGGSQTPAFCKDLDALNASMSQLKTADVRAQGVEATKTQLKAIGNDLEKLSSDAKTQFAPQITEVKKQATELKTTLEAATASPTEETISAARRNVGELKNAFLDLQAALQATC
jgi:uncharacterized protein HemX